MVYIHNPLRNITTELCYNQKVPLLPMHWQYIHYYVNLYGHRLRLRACFPVYDRAIIHELKLQHAFQQSDILFYHKLNTLSASIYTYIHTYSKGGRPKS